jgi:hypothetical protein
MNTNINKRTNLTIIEERVSGQSFRLAGLSINKDYNLKKIFIDKNVSHNWVKEQFPQTEIVNDNESIIHDSDIDLIILSGSQKEELHLVAEILNTGKNLRIV